MGGSWKNITPGSDPKPKFGEELRFEFEQTQKGLSGRELGEGVEGG
jgi:hypothetical protein